MWNLLKSDSVAQNYRIASVLAVRSEYGLKATWPSGSGAVKMEITEKDGKTTTVVVMLGEA